MSENKTKIAQSIVLVGSCTEQRVRKAAEDIICAKLNEKLQDDCINSGVWFKSSVSGMMYRNYKSAGDIECVCIDGAWYDKG